MIERTTSLPVTRQCRLLALSRASVYYQGQGPSEEELRLMALIDQAHLARPYYGSRRIRDWLEDRGHRVNRKRVQRLMRRMGLIALYPKANTSRPGPGHTIYPYRLRGLTIERPNQVWTADITYIPMAKGFLYLVAVMDWHSRKVLAWRLSNTLESEPCIEALEEALHRYGPPEIMNTDQGAQFTSDAFTQGLKDHGITISMDGKGSWRDNVFIERLWRSLKYEEVYLHAYEDAQQAKKGISDYLNFYNGERRHQGLDRKTPNQVHSGQPLALKAA